MTGVLTQLVIVSGLVILILGVVKLVILPMSNVFEVKRRPKPATRGDSARPEVARPVSSQLVSVVVPAYNEGAVIENCLRSVLCSDHRNLELIVVDDGSTDDTLESARRCTRGDDRVTLIAKSNGGKGSALNRGIEKSTGDIVLLVDSDGVFAPDMIDHMLLAFDSPKVAAVCGDDRPINLDRVQTRFLSMISHVGTGLVRRALSLIGCLTIVSGNAGAFRRSVLTELGGLDEDTVGEDLELTWRVHKAGYQVRFEPRALVHAESPSTLGGLWKQRTRWNRGLLQVTAKHIDMVGNPRHGAVSLYLLFNTVSAIFAPILQLLVLVLLPFLLVSGTLPISRDMWGFLLWLGLGTSVFFMVVAVALNRAWTDLRFLWTLPLWPIFSIFSALTLVNAMLGQLRGGRAEWNKLPRTGVVTAPGLQALPAEHTGEPLAALSRVG